MKYKLTFLLFGIVLFLSCEEDDIFKSNAIETNIEIFPTEYVDINSKVFGLSCKTEEIFPCSNYTIISEVSSTSDKIEVSFTDIPEIDICLTAPRAALTFVDLSSIPPGEYQLELNNDKLHNQGTLSISNEEITVALKTQTGIKIIRNTTKLMPEGTFWGTVGYHTESTVDLVNEFIERLEILDGITNFNNQEPGFYSFYEINQAGEIVSESISGYHFTEYFIFQYEGNDPVGFKGLIDSLSSLYVENMIINFQNSHGDRIYNWD